MENNFIKSLPKFFVAAPSGDLAPRVESTEFGTFSMLTVREFCCVSFNANTFFDTVKDLEGEHIVARCVLLPHQTEQVIEAACNGIHGASADPFEVAILETINIS